MNTLVSAFHRALELMDPLSLQESLQEIFAAIKAKVEVVQAVRIGDVVKELLTTLWQPLEVFNPAAFQPTLESAYTTVKDSLVGGAMGVLDRIRDKVDAKLDEARAVLLELVAKVKAMVDRGLQLLGDLTDQLGDLVLNEVVARLHKVIVNLGVSFDNEVDRVVAAFNKMLKAVPV